MHYHTTRPVGSMLIACGAFAMQREVTKDPALVTCAACVEELAVQVERQLAPLCSVCNHPYNDHNFKGECLEPGCLCGRPPFR